MIPEFMQTNKYLQYLIIGGVFLVLLVPFIIAPSSFFPFITGKNFAFRIIVEVILGAWILLALRDATYRPKRSGIAMALSAFVAVLAVATFLSENPHKSFWSNYERMEGYITLLHLFAYFVVASSVLNVEKLWIRFFQSSVGVSVVMAFYGLLQLAGKITINQGGVRLDGTLGNAAYLGTFMLLNFFIALFLLARSRSSVAWRYIYGIAMLLQLVILYHTATRGALAGLIVGLITASVAVALFERRERALRISAIALLGVIAVGIIGFISIRNADFVKSSPVLSRFASISVEEFKGSARSMVWPMALQGFKERPIFGWGQESFNFVFNKYYNPGMYAQEQWFDRTHNVVLDWLIAGGALGLLSYLSILVFAVYYIWVYGSERFSVRNLFRAEIPHLLEKSVLTGLIAGYFFQNLFVFDNITSYILFFSVLAYVHSTAARPIKKLESVRIDPAVALRVAAPIVVIVFAFILYMANVVPLKASTTLINALRQQPEGVQKNLDHFKKALAYKSFGTTEIREQLTQAAAQVIYAQTVSLELKQAYYDLARAEFIKQIERVPNDARHTLFLGSFLNRVRNYDEALTYLNRSLELSPKKQTILFELGSVYINKGDTAKALETMKQAFDLDQRYTEGRIIYAVAAVYAKDFALAKELMQPLSETNHQHDDRLINAYMSQGQADTVISILEKRVSLNPADPSARFSLASLYMNVGSRTKAVNTLQSIARDFPDQKEQAEQFIKEIQAGKNP